MIQEFYHVTIFDWSLTHVNGKDDLEHARLPHGTDFLAELSFNNEPYFGCVRVECMISTDDLKLFMYVYIVPYAVNYI